MPITLDDLPGRGSMVATCAECPNQFRIFPSFLKYRPYPTCSMACRTARTSREARERNSRPCVVCGKLFYDTPGAFEKEGRKACGTACKAIWQTGRKLADPNSEAIRFRRYRVVQDGCYGWTGTIINGYGVLAGSVRRIGAHRYAWEQATGETLTTEDTICHTCDNPPCTRNDDEGTYEVEGILYPRRGHLFKATDPINAKDMHQKGRNRTSRSVGERNPRAKLTEGDVRVIRAALADGATYSELSSHYSVTVTLIRMIGQRKIWKHVTEPHQADLTDP